MEYSHFCVLRVHSSDILHAFFSGDMTEAVIIDLFHGQLLSDSQETWLREAIVKNYATKKTKQVFIMCKQQSPKSTNNSTQNIVLNVLEKFGALKEVIETVEEPSMAAAFYRFKREIDELNLSTVKIIAPTPRKAILEAYLDLLFTAVYQFEFEVLPNDPESMHIESPGPGHCRDGAILAGQQLEQIKREVSTFLGQLPSLRGDITILHSSLIPDMCFLHGFTTRTGGISYTPTLSSLNLFSSSSRRDPKAVVAENIRRLSQKAGFDQESYRRVQVDHGSDVWIMGRREPESYDGIVTNQSGVTLVAPGADCMPLLFADPVQKAIGAAHAGWKGTLLGVAMATVNALVSEYGCDVKDIVVVVGPSVGSCCFTLDQKSAKEFHDINPKCVREMDSAKPYVDIRLATRILLERGGVLPHNIQDDSVSGESHSLGLCTACHADKFFSHVRDRNNFGTQIGFISIKK